MVTQNKLKYTKDELSRADKAVQLQGDLMYVAHGKLKEVIEDGTIINVPFPYKDLDNSLDIYGMPILIAKGKTTCKTSRPMAVPVPPNIPVEILK
eukprot:CAMPEP_0184859592 /NCGR_PEP_ID=MMETSP0580-20130426/4584_1 /TAXON_ID=1118495 /ORGANISM="Dactyliosolen fragilissimus" /LENGTH=94 /DNA_ID=CAMNT_0027356323 /DNA_START=1751 /DNA_END=2035 /DNA_ORIENTATION=+